MKRACCRGGEIAKDVPPTRDSEFTTVPHSFPSDLLARGRVASSCNSVGLYLHRHRDNHRGQSLELVFAQALFRSLLPRGLELEHDEFNVLLDRLPQSHIGKALNLMNLTNDPR